MRSSPAADVHVKTYDVVVIGRTPGGIACSLRAASEGLTVLLVQHNRHIGGIAAKQHLEFYGLSEVRTHKDRTGKYGRLLATLIGVHGDELIDLNQRTIDDGHAEPM